MLFRKLAELANPSGMAGSKITQKLINKSHFQTVQSQQPQPPLRNPIPIPQPNPGLALPNLQQQKVPLPKPSTNSKNFPTSTSRRTRVSDILESVRSTDTLGLQFSPAHVEHLVGRASRKVYQNQHDPDQANAAKIPQEQPVQGSGIDIADKTQLILQSPHPVRYVLVREIQNSQKGFQRRLPSYHAWLMIFGRSLFQEFKGHLSNHHHHHNHENRDLYDLLLNNIACAADSGMFSTDIHLTILDIPLTSTSTSSSTSVDTDTDDDTGHSSLHAGNKYAVLVGDYFAIRCLYYAERTKVNSVMAAITEGVEEFATCTFGTNLFDQSLEICPTYPQILSPTTGIHDWVLYNQKALGYFKGGLNATMSLIKNNDPSISRKVREFCANFAIFLKAVEELDALEEQRDAHVPSPFLLASLPAIFAQLENPRIFANLRKLGLNSQDHGLDAEHIFELNDAIRSSAFSMQRTKDLMQGFARDTKQSFRDLAPTDAYYANVFESMIDAVSEEFTV